MSITHQHFQKSTNTVNAPRAVELIDDMTNINIQEVNQFQARFDGKHPILTLAIADAATTYVTLTYTLNAVDVAALAAKSELDGRIKLAEDFLKGTLEERGAFCETNQESPLCLEIFNDLYQNQASI